METDHFRITYTPELNSLVPAAAARAEEAYLLLARQLIQPPKGKIDLLLSDDADVTNGYATPLPSNRIVVFVKPPVEDIELGRMNDWLDLVITHELAHIFHLDVSGLVGRALRTLFGRAPFSWPIFPALDLPRWNIEGLAVEFETRGTASARLHGSFHEMVVRTAVLEDRLDPIDRMNGETPIWPGGQRAYIYGSLFMDYLARNRGADAQARLTSKTKGSILPASLLLNNIGKRALGSSLTDQYAAWELELRARYGALADSLRARGLTQTERITTRGQYAWFPRVSPDGGRLAYAEDNGRESAMTRVLDLASGRTVWRNRRNGIGPADWLPDGSLITAQFEVADRYALLLDLYRVSESGESRLTHGARLEEPDVDAAGQRVIAAELGRGSNRLVLLDRNGNLLRPLTPNTVGVGWSMPRWSPAGDRIAVSRWQQGGAHDIVVLDTLGSVLSELTRDDAVDASPAWSPDGRYVLFWSDRTGIPNLFAVDQQNGELKQVTNLLTGAFHPEVSPDGRYIYFSGYHHDGYHIERMAFDPASWTAAPPTRPASSQRPRAALDSAAALHVQTTVSEPREYSAFPTLRPFYWLPSVITEDEVGTFVGVSTSGQDLLLRHSWALVYEHEFGDQRNQGFFAYDWSGLGNPNLGVSLSRDWDWLGTARLIRSPIDTSFIQVLEREDVGALSATFLRRRFRSSASLTIAGEVVQRTRFAADTPNVNFSDPRDRMFGGIARVGYATYRTPRYAISREDGVLLQVGGRVRVEPDTAAADFGYRELSTYNTAYKSLFLAGFAHHVLAARFSAIVREGTQPPLTRVGGVPGGGYDFGLAVVGEGGAPLPVRGYGSQERRGRRAWSASLEYRAPVALIGRGVRLWPLFVDRVYATAFADAGDAMCEAIDRTRTTRCAAPGADPLVSAGIEFGADVGLFSFFTTRLRLGVAQPFTGAGSTQFYVTFGPAF